MNETVGSSVPLRFQLYIQFAELFNDVQNLSYDIYFLHTSLIDSLVYVEMQRTNFNFQSKLSHICRHCA